MSISLDVIYHLTEDNIFNDYMKSLFSSSLKYVVIYASNYDDNSANSAAHVRHRKFTNWIDLNLKGWILINYTPNRYPISQYGNKGSFADFFVYKKEEI
jgi:hypothetical protein